MPDPPAAPRPSLGAAVAALRDAATVPPRLVAVLAAVAAVAVGATVGVVALRGSPPAPELTLPRAGAGGAGAPAGGGGAEPEPEPDVYVHAAGAVVRPGLYRVGPGGRVADVVEAAGGPAPAADLDQVNLAARVADGERVYVPRRGEAVPSGAGGDAAAAGPGGPGEPGGPGGRLDLNSATAAQLEALPGVGPATARAILDHRRQRGRFASVEELLEVPGIGEAKLAALRSKVRV